MTPKQIQVLSTRKLSSSQKQALLKAEVELDEFDFIEVECLDFPLEVPHKNMIFTSQNAVKSFLRHSRAQDLKVKGVFCVGFKTKELLEKNGFEVKVCTDYAFDLARIICSDYSKEDYSFFCGNLRRETLPQALKEAGISFEEVFVYKTSLSPHKTEKNYEAILFFSPSGVESYLKDNKIKDALCICIGETTADSLTHLTKKIVVSKKPLVESVIEALIDKFKSYRIK